MSAVSMAPSRSRPGRLGGTDPASCGSSDQTPQIRYNRYDRPPGGPQVQYHATELRTGSIRHAEPSPQGRTTPDSTIRTPPNPGNIGATNKPGTAHRLARGGAASTSHPHGRAKRRQGPCHRTPTIAHSHRGERPHVARRSSDSSKTPGTCHSRLNMMASPTVV